MTSEQAHKQPSAAQTHEHQALETAYPITLTNLHGALVVLVGGGAVGDAQATWAAGSRRGRAADQPGCHARAARAG